jgi:short-subunit dehydrogenase
MRESGLRVLLTGASGEIGTEVARRLAAHGATLALSGRDAGRLDRLAGEIAAADGARPVVLPCDLSRRGAGAELGRRALDELGHVDVLINNAGASIQGLTWVWVTEMPRARCSRRISGARSR